MLTLLRSWLYAAEREALGDSGPDYVASLNDAIQAMDESSDPTQTIVLLRYQSQAAESIRSVAGPTGSAL